MTDNWNTSDEVDNLCFNAVPILCGVNISLCNTGQANNKIRKLPLGINQQAQCVDLLIALELHRPNLNDVIGLRVYSGRFEIERYKDIFVNAGQLVTFSETLCVRES